MLSNPNCIELDLYKNNGLEETKDFLDKKKIWWT